MKLNRKSEIDLIFVSVNLSNNTLTMYRRMMFLMKLVFISRLIIVMQIGLMSIIVRRWESSLKIGFPSSECAKSNASSLDVI